MPDSIIHEILSRLDDTKEAVRTCILSKNWTHHWKYVHSLSFHHESFKTGILAFEEFVLHVLQHRQHSINIRKLRFFLGAKQNQSLINCVLDHAMLRQLKKLETDVCSFPPSLLESRTLETVNYGVSSGDFIVRSNSMIFARLKNLQLTGVHIDCNDFFSCCSNLENLRLTDCRVSNTEILNINLPRLVQLIITDIRYDKGLIIIISGPKLKRFEFKGIYNPYNPSLVLEIRRKMNEDLNLVKLKFYCSDGELDSIDSIIETLTSIVFEYAISHRFEELETDIVDNFPATLFECQTLKTLKLGQTTKCLRGLSGFATLTTLQLSSVIIDLENDMFFGCLNLENLLLIECTLLADPVQVVMGDYTISAPWLVNLQISDFLYRGRLVINGPRLKFF
ncbi:hypothetical protein EZV62_020899 [Acer yangbiense]|uniref:F-box/LRR-repeat protein 15/At3g58940/PEG3-like LRR domain-containing protein n=1 Tax=Acer yangbiense TaxID=1000413 RepID=A0A5C7HET1_9ROSI|nr:hypothetical protein EZV62_020899 [Acer yangbiense]